MATRGRIRDAADLAVDAAELRARCDQLLRRLRHPGEPTEVAQLRALLGDNADFQVRQIEPGPLWILYFSSVINPQMLVNEIYRPWAEAAELGPHTVRQVWVAADPLTGVRHAAELLTVGEAVIIDGAEMCSLNLRSVPERAVAEPSTERSIMGPKEAFNERLDTSAALLRQRLPSVTLRLEEVRVGRRSRTRVFVAYLSDVAHPGLAPWVLGILRHIDMDTVRDAEQIAAFLTTNRWGIFPLIERSERPDRVAHGLTRGRLAVLVDGTPFVLILPTTIWEEQHDSESALNGPVVAMYVRTLRKLGAVAATIAPGFYVAVLTTNIGILWPRLALALVQTRTGVPYPVLTETLIMLVVVDIFAQATVQAPSGVGGTLTIVGTLIIGQISVQARLASQLMMLVIASSALGAFLTLKYPFSYGLRILKYALVAFAAVGGLFGWMVGISISLLHLCSLRSAGLSYMAPATPMMPRAMAADYIANLPEPSATHRPSEYRPGDPTSKTEEQ